MKAHGTAWLALLAIFYVVAGDAPPGVNEAHYLVKAKNFWDPQWCANDLFASSGKAHSTFYWTFGWPTLFFSLETTAWIGRAVAWSLIAAGLLRLVQALAMPPASALVVSLVWIAGVEHGNLAGEWVIGGIEAKVPAYGFTLFGLANLVERRWDRAWVWFGLAAAMHVLTGGWSVIAAMTAFGWTERVSKRNRFATKLAKHSTDPAREVISGDSASFLTKWLLLGGTVAILGVWPAMAMSSGATDAEVAAAARAHSYLRLSHHLTPAAFATWWYVRHVMLLALTTALILPQLPAEPWRRLAGFGIGAVAITIMGLIIGLLPAVAPEFAAKLLRYYWFRLGDAVVPLLLGLSVSGLIFAKGDVTQLRPLCRPAALAVLVFSVLLTAHSTWQRVATGVPVSVSNRLIGLDADADYATQRQAMKDWIAVCRYIRASSDPAEVFLTPRHQQTFKWYAHRAEVVNWKDVPQDASSLIEWKNRFWRVYPLRLSTMRVTIQYDALRELRRDYGVQFMVVDRRVSGQSLPLVQVYPVEGDVNSTYAIYRLP